MTSVPHGDQLGPALESPPSFNMIIGGKTFHAEVSPNQEHRARCLLGSTLQCIEIRLAYKRNVLFPLHPRDI